jgi:uncharacterized protein
MNNYWQKFAQIILNNRLSFLLGVLAMTIFMVFAASNLKISYELPKILPKSDERFQLYETFKKRFGEDGSVMVIGVETDKMYDLDFFQNWYDLNKEIKKMDGIKDVVCNANVPLIYKTDSLKLATKSILTKRPTNKAELDSVKSKLALLPYYKNFIFSEDNKAHLMLVTFDQKAINDKGRIDLVKKISSVVETFEAKNKINLHISGMPFIRTAITTLVSNELGSFLLYAIAVTSLILLLFFRSFKIMGVALIVVTIGFVCTLGIIVLFDYRVTMLTGLIPALIVIIGVPNTIFLLNKYHEEYSEHGDQKKALLATIEKIGKTLFLANVTTSIGFGVFVFTGSALLVEFGIIASINIMLTYLVSLIVIPIIFSYLAPPKKSEMSHLEGKRITTILTKIEYWVLSKRTMIYTVIVALAAISGYGMSKIESIGFIVDDLPEDNAIYTDLKFIEKHFKGVMPFEVSIDAYEKGRAMTPQMLIKIRRLEKEFAKYPEFTKPISLVTLSKVIYQAHKGGDPKYFILPGIDELGQLQQYGNSLPKKENRFSSMLDSTKRYTRVSVQMADVGTVRTTEIINTLQPKVDSIFNFDSETGVMYKKGDKNGYDAQITGNSVVYAWQNEYLQKNLVESTFQAIMLICLIMAMLFRSWRMVIISTLPSLIPLLITAGLMGYFGIHLKYSTILIFSIAFGISSDGTIYFLTRYKDELQNNKRSVKDAVRETIQNTGVSMFYTAIVLFTGFFVFTASTFKGTVSLGILVSITLLIAMICNLILLPAFLMTMDKRSAKKMVE